MPWVRIKEGMRHRSGTLKGGDVAEVSEAEVVSFGDKFEPVSRVLEQVIPEVLATKAAKDYAEEHRISLSLSNIQGSGKEGRITLADVKTALQAFDEDALAEDSAHGDA